MDSCTTRQRLAALSTQIETIAAVAMDQRKSLRRLIAEAASRDLDHIPDSALVEFKTAVVEAFSPRASAVLLDTEYGLRAAGARASQCGLLLAYESDGYENPRPHRMLALMPGYSVRRLRELGAGGIKILLHYSPLEETPVREQKHAFIERIGNECAALEMPFFLEPVLYDPSPAGNGAVPRDPSLQLESARKKPRLVIEIMREFSKDIYNVDILKVEFPVAPAFVEGSAVFSGSAAYSMREALDWFRAADEAAGRPYIYLSAGVGMQEFLESLRLAARAGSRFSGVLCGRALWQDGVPAYAREGLPGLRKWLGSTGLRNFEALHDLLGAATPWTSLYRRAEK